MPALKKSGESCTLQDTVAVPVQHFLLQTGDRRLHHVTAVWTRSPAFGRVFVVLTHCVGGKEQGGLVFRF